ELDAGARDRLRGEIEAIDFDELDRLIVAHVDADAPPAPAAERVGPIDVFRLPRTDGDRIARRHLADIGSAALAAGAGGGGVAAGEVAVVVVAGGSGTRLGFDGPKGTYPIGPVSAATLFQIHAEKVVARGRRHGKPLPFYVMTSPENHDETTRFFAAHDQFGL